jgi:uncharacterized protein
MGEKVPIKQGIFMEDFYGGVLLGNKCVSCGQIFFPKARFCFSCFNEDLEGIILNRRGKLCSYTVAHIASTHFEPPYAAGFVDLPEGVRIFVPLKIVEGKPFKVGMEVEVVIEKLWEEGDKEVIGYKFRPI